MSYYETLAHQVGSPDALELGHQLAAWHDRMVTHQRLQAMPTRRECDDGCPHDQSIELWQAAIEHFGDAADRLVFLKTVAGQTVDSGTTPDGTGASRAFSASAS